MAQILSLKIQQHEIEQFARHTETELFLYWKNAHQF